MPSANPSIEVPTPAQKPQPFHRMPHIAATAILPERPPIVIPAATDLSYWLNSKWEFYAATYVGETYTRAVEFIVYPDGSFQLFVYSAATYAGGGCQQSVLDNIIGNLVVNSNPSSLSFPPSRPGTESFRDTCNPALNYDNPINITYVWLASPWNQTGSQWHFQHAGYSSPFNSFIITRQQ